MSPRSKEQNKQVRQASINNILDASLELFAMKGFDATSIAMIAQKAGISKGLLYNYFSGKEDLLKGLVERMNTAESDLMHDVISDHPLKTLENVIKLFFTELRHNYQQWVFMSKLIVQVDQFDFIKQITIDKYNGYITLIEQLLQASGHETPKEEARIIAALFDGIGYQYLLMRDSYPLDEMENYLISKYCTK